MELIIKRYFLPLSLAFFAAHVQAESIETTGVAKLLHGVAESATVEQHAQITDAIKISPMLTTQFNKLVSTGKLTELLLVSSSAAASLQKPGPFNGWIKGSKIILADSLLMELRKNIQFDVRRENDIYPNNTTFVLGHLAYHLTEKLEMPSARPENIEEAVRVRLENEALAFIQGWNDVVDAAVQANGGQALTGQQVGSLLLNLRYRFAFVQALRQPAGKLQLLQSGLIEANDANVKAIAAVLRNSAMSDIE